jgi:hypothetical protein
MATEASEFHATDFAITTVNVPDRLDLRDMDDRNQVEEIRQRALDRSAFRIWAPRLLAIALFVVLAFCVFELIDLTRTTLSADSLSERLTRQLGVPVKVGDSRFALLPSPHLQLSQTVVDGDLAFDSLAIAPTEHLFSQLLQGHWSNWLEVRGGDTRMGLEQGRQLVNLLPRLGRALPQAVGSMRIAALTIADPSWLAGPWEVRLVREGRRGDFSSLTASATRVKGQGRLDVQLFPGGDPAVVAFQAQGQAWQLPIGPSLPIEELVASGSMSAGGFQISQYSLGGTYGAVRGSLSLLFEAGNPARPWSVHGTALSEALDVEALLRHLEPPPPDTTPQPAILQGTAVFSGLIEGRGATASEALAGATLAAPVHMRGPVLNGVNLGYVATHPGGNPSNGSSAITRLTSLEADVVVTGGRTQLRQIRAHSGALASSGEIGIDEAHRLSGSLRVDLGAARVLAPIHMDVRGTLQHPEFGR